MTFSAGIGVLQKGHIFCLIPPIVASFFLQFGHSACFDADAGLKHITRYLLYFSSEELTLVFCLNIKLCEVIKAKTAYPFNDVLRKVIYLTTIAIDQNSLRHQ